MVVDGKALKLLLHINGETHIFEGALLSKLNVAHKGNAVTVRVVPVKVCVEGQ